MEAGQPGIGLGWALRNTTNRLLQIASASGERVHVAIVPGDMAGTGVFDQFAIVQLAYGATAVRLADRKRYPGLFRLAPALATGIDAMSSLLDYFRWRRNLALMYESPTAELQRDIQERLGRSIVSSWLPIGADTASFAAATVKVAENGNKIFLVL